MPAAFSAASTGSTTFSSSSTASVTTRTERNPRSAIIPTSSADDPGPVKMNGVGAGASLVAIPSPRMRSRVMMSFNGVTLCWGKSGVFLRSSGRRGKCHRYARNSPGEAVVLAGAKCFHNGGLQVDSDIGGFVR